MPVSEPTPPDLIPLTIHALDMHGQGVGTHESMSVHVPHTAIGDHVHVHLPSANKPHLTAHLEALVTPSPDRVNPPCAVAGQCGGCQLQHLSREAQSAYKQQKLLTMLARAGLSETQIHTIARPLHTFPVAGRRRIELACTLEHGEMLVGFHAANSHQVIPIPHCMVCDAAINAALSPLRHLSNTCPQRKDLRHIHLQHTGENTLDIILKTSKPYKQAALEHWQTGIRDAGITGRVIQQTIDARTGSVTGARVIVAHTPTIALAGITVELPEGAFLQANAQAQQTLTDFVLEHIPATATTLDIYAGIGTYNLPLLARGQQVSTAEGSEAMTQAVFNAARRAGKEHMLDARTCDLYKNPLRAEALAKFEAIVINPPRNGASPQIKEIARAHIPHVVMISCNPATAERDARILLEAGYTLHTAVGIDQFPMTYHLEVALAFSRAV